MFFVDCQNSAERKLRNEPYWSFDWQTGEKRQVGQDNTVKGE